MAFSGRWLYNKDQLRQQTLKHELDRKYALKEEKKRKLEKAQIMLEKYRNS